MLCQPTKRNLARFNCKTGRREFTPDDNEQPGPSTEPSVTPTDKSNNLLRKQRSLSGKHMHLSISATESINLQPKGNDKRSKTALSNTGRNRFNDDIAKDVRHLEKHVTLGNDIQRSRTALPDTGRSRFTDDIAKDVGHLEKHKPTSLNKIDDCNKIQKSNIEKKHTTMLVLSSMSDSSIDDNPAGMQTDMIQQCQDGILNQVEHLDSRLAEIGSTAIEPKYTDKKDTNRKFSSVYLSENTDDSETDADDKETIVGKLNINDRESFQNDINNTDFHINTSVECFHEGDRKRHARKSSTDDGNTSVFRNTQLSYTPVHCRKINNDVGDEISNSKTSKESPEFKDSKDEESICNDNNSPLVECVAIFSTDNEHSEANTGDNLTSSFETIIKACSNILGADDGTITLKEIDNDIINKKQNPSRTSSRLVIDATNSYSCTPDNIPGHEIKEGTLSGEIKIMQEHKLTDSFKHGTYDNLETAMSPISDKNKKCDGLKEEHKTFGENNGGGNDTFPAYACASKAETRIGAINYSMTGLDGNNDGAARTLRNGFVSLENKIVIPTDFGEDSSDFDQTDSEYEAETAASKHSDDDVAELKALLEMTTCRRAENVKIDNLDKEPEKIEITNGQPSEDYVQFVREKTMDTTKAKKIKKVKARKNDKKEKIHKSVIPHERNAKTKPTDDARQKKVVTKKPKTTHKQDSTKKTKKKSKQV